MKKSGRPTKYKKKYAGMLVEFFSVAPNREVAVVITTAKSEIVKTELKPNKLPTFHEFAARIKVNGDTIVEWSKATIGKSKKLKYPEFAAAYKKAKELQKWFLIENGLNSLYNPAFAIFTAKNITDMRDKQELDHTSKGQKIQWNVVSYKNTDEKK